VKILLTKWSKKRTCVEAQEGKGRYVLIVGASIEWGNFEKSEKKACDPAGYLVKTGIECLPLPILDRLRSGPD
jgi:hypothetical protein